MRPLDIEREYKVVKLRDGQWAAEAVIPLEVLNAKLWVEPDAPDGGRKTRLWRELNRILRDPK